MGARERQLAIERTYRLFKNDPYLEQLKVEPIPELKDLPHQALERKLYQANLRVKPWQISVVSLLIALAFALIASIVVAPLLMICFAVVGALIPFIYINSRVDRRAAQFAVDYPTILLATASSVKAGLTPIEALERSVKLLTPKSLVRREVEQLVKQLRQGVRREDAVGRFGAGIAMPDLPLFRRAFLLVLENGGRFAPTLARLASVSKDREMLIASARVSTSMMRMTANVLIIMAPVLLLLISLRSDEFWQTLIEHPVANSIASTGVVIIAVSYGVLRRMSNFKP